MSHVSRRKHGSRVPVNQWQLQTEPKMPNPSDDDDGGEDGDDGDEDGSDGDGDDDGCHGDDGDDAGDGGGGHHTSNPDDYPHHHLLRSQ